MIVEHFPEARSCPGSRKFILRVYLFSLELTRLIFILRLFPLLLSAELTFVLFTTFVVSAVSFVCVRYFGGKRCALGE